MNLGAPWAFSDREHLFHRHGIRRRGLTAREPHVPAQRATLQLDVPRTVISQDQAIAFDDRTRQSFPLFFSSAHGVTLVVWGRKSIGFTASRAA